MEPWDTIIRIIAGGGGLYAGYAIWQTTRAVWPAIKETIDGIGN
jgi:hypothetical protein